MASETEQERRETLADIVAEIRAYGAQPPPRLMWLEIADRIEEKCTVHSADIVAVLKALENVVTESILAGRTLRLGNLGTIGYAFHCKGTETKEAFTAENIKHVALHFHFAPRIVKAVNRTGGRLSLQNVEKKTTPSDEDGD